MVSFPTYQDVLDARQRAMELTDKYRAAVDLGERERAALRDAACAQTESGCRVLQRWLQSDQRSLNPASHEKHILPGADRVAPKRRGRPPKHVQHPPMQLAACARFRVELPGAVESG
jgi:hypothetical protein